MALQIIKSSFLSLLQDYGRYGYQHTGLTHSGPLDEHAFLWANRLLGNDYNAPQIEISYGVFAAEFTEETVIALCGADLNTSINNQNISPWQTYNVCKGDVINFVKPKFGLRCYLAIKGGFKIDKTLSSVATVMREKLGGLKGDGAKLAAGATLTYKKSPPQQITTVAKKYIPHYKQEVTLRFVPNSTIASAGVDALQALQAQQFTVSQKIDRMAYRLSGSPIESGLTGIVSQGVSAGSIQLPKDGQPIVLMKDCQTMGGYPLLGCVSALDLALLAQAAPGVKVEFKKVDVDRLESEWLTHKKFFNTQL